MEAGQTVSDGLGLLCCTATAKRVCGFKVELPRLGESLQATIFAYKVFCAVNKSPSCLTSNVEIFHGQSATTSERVSRVVQSLKQAATWPYSATEDPCNTNTKPIIELWSRLVQMQLVHSTSHLVCVLYVYCLDHCSCTNFLSKESLYVKYYCV